MGLAPRLLSESIIFTNAQEEDDKRLSALEKYGIYQSLQELQSAKPIPGSPFTLLTNKGRVEYSYLLGDFTGKADNDNCVKLMEVSLKDGALVKQNSDGLSFPQILSGYRNLTDKIRESISIKDFGAVGDGITDDRVAIQRAIDWMSLRGGGTLKIPNGTFLMSWTLAPDAGVCCLVLKEGVSIVGDNAYTSTLKVANNSIGSGTYNRWICTNGRVNKVALVNFTIDGNSGGQGLYSRQGNGGNIVIDASECFIEGVRSLNANGQGIQVRGGPTNVVEIVSIKNCFVVGCQGSTINPDGSVAAEYNGNGIGIQVGYAKDVQIIGNTIRSCKDNGIDTYNESGSFDAVGGGVIISHNIIRSCRVAIFPETSSRTMIVYNYIEDMSEAGVALNRINSAPSLVTVKGNTIRTTLVGVRISGNMESAIIDDNFIENITALHGACIGLYTAANVLIKNNTFKTNNPDIPLIRTGDAQAVFISVGENYFFGTPTRDRMIFRAAADHFGFNVWGQFIPVNNGGVVPIGEGDAFTRNAGRFNSVEVGGPFGANGATAKTKIALPADPTDLATALSCLKAMKDLLKEYGLAKEI